MSYTWPLADNTFNFWDRLKICRFFLDFRNRWTQDKYVREYERKMAEYVGCKYAVMVSSGSTANQLIAQQIKDKLVSSGDWPKRNKVIISSVTWQTNVSVFVREGFEPVFLDIDLNDFCLNLNDLDEYLVANSDRVACVFPTSVLGFGPNFPKLIELEQKYPQVKFALDNCENFFGDTCIGNICSYFTCSTSGFVAHHINSGAESGLIFTNSEEEYRYFLLSRAHGLLRNLFPYTGKENGNSLVDPQFDFQTLSSNYRNTDIVAFLSLLNFDKFNKDKEHRRRLYELFYLNLDKDKYLLPIFKELDCAFCLPIVIRNSDSDRMNRVKNYLDSNKIERRPFISGNMLRQIPYQKYGNYKDFVGAEMVNNFGMYVGLHSKITEEDVLKLVRELNNL